MMVVLIPLCRTILFELNGEKYENLSTIAEVIIKMKVAHCSEARGIVSLILMSVVVDDCMRRRVGRFVGNRYVGGSVQTPIWLDDVRCTGTETDIAHCLHRRWGSHNCGHSEDVSVACLAGRPNTVDLSLNQGVGVSRAKPPN